MVSTSCLCATRAAAALGYLPQDIDLFRETVRDIIARLDGADLQQVIDAAKADRPHDMIIRLPQAYVPSSLAEGQSLAWFSPAPRPARAFFGDPHLVVLDERTPSLDYLGERVLFEAIERMKAANTTVIIITHRIGILAATNKIAIMQGGASALRRQQGNFREVFGPASVSSRESAQSHRIRNATAARRLTQPILP